MSRFLTPAKIGLLALIDLYTEEAVPTDAILPVLNFLASRLLDCDLTETPSVAPANRWAKAENSIRLIVSIQDFEQLLGPFAAVDRMPGRRLWDRFLEKLWGIDSLHALQEFFEKQPHLLAKTKDELRRMTERGEDPPTGILLSRNSPFGAFVRRSHLELSRLPFHSTAELWKAFVTYRQPTANDWRRRNPHHSRLSFDSVLMAGEQEWGENTEELAVVAYGRMLLGDHDHASLVSTDDIERLLEMQVEQIHSKLLGPNHAWVPLTFLPGYGDRVPKELKAQFQTLLKDSHAIPSLSHYVSFCDAWRSSDYPTSFEHLHRYFDYTMQNRDRLFYQYALMNLAMLQSDFGCHKEAVATMLETVSTARENRDNTCLNFALNWLFHFGRTHPKLVRELESNSMLGSGKETLAFLRAKAKESGMWVLWSSALMGEAKLAMASGESVSAAMEHMVRSSQIIVERNLKAMVGSKLSVATTLWDRLGLAYLSNMTCEVFLRCHADTSVFDDKLKATCRLAGHLAGRGQYEAAFAKLESLGGNPLRSVKVSQHWHLYRGILQLRRAMHRGTHEAVDHLLAQLLQAGPDSLETDMVFIVDSLHIEALTRRGDFDAATAKIERLLTELRDDDRDVALRIRLLLSKAHLFDRVGRPEKGFTITLRAASMAWRARLLPLLWQAMGALANILGALGEFAAAARLVVAVLPRCLETDAVFVVATLYSLLADAWVGQAGEEAGGPTATHHSGRREAFLAEAHEALEAAFHHFSAVEDVEKQCEMLAKEAMVMKLIGDKVRAEEYAARYLKLKKEGYA